VKSEWFKLRDAYGLESEWAVNLQAVIFDLDGVITDTAEYHYLAWKRLADEEKLPFDRKINERLRGVSRRASLEIVLDGKRVTEKRLAEMMERKNSYYVAMLKRVTPADLLPGVLPLLQELHAAGIKIAIGSASKNAKSVLAALGIGDLLDAVADGYSAGHPKPAPDLFLHAAATCGAPQRMKMMRLASNFWAGWWVDHRLKS